VPQHDAAQGLLLSGCVSCLVVRRAERTGPGALTHLTNRVFLHSLASARSLAGAAAWAGCQLLGAGRPDNRFTLRVRTPAGASLALPVVRGRSLLPAPCS
jgi:hypothetical protein